MNPTKVKCPHCGWVQVTRSDAVKIGCSSCQLRFRKAANVIEGGLE